MKLYISKKSDKQRNILACTLSKTMSHRHRYSKSAASVLYSPLEPIYTIMANTATKNPHACSRNPLLLKNGRSKNGKTVMTKAKPTYKHPSFIIETQDKRIEKENKRLWLSLCMDKDAKESLLVILKNPSRATKEISDKTVFNVTNYVYKNRFKYSAFKNIGTIILINLIPFYETYAHQLVTLGNKIIDNQNSKTIKALTSKHKNVIIAWGDHPKGLYEQYEQLKNTTFDILKTNKNTIFYVDKLSIYGNPKHGQVWGYNNKLIPFKF
jgi:hypothetical protein